MPSQDAPERKGGIPTGPVSRRVRDLWFYGVFLASLLAVGVLFYPYRYVLLFAAVLVVVTWPVFDFALRRLKGRRTLAAVLSLITVIIGGVVPLALIGAMAWREGVGLVKRAVELAADPEKTAGLAQQAQRLMDKIPDFLAGYLPSDPVAAVTQTLEGAAASALDFATSQVPGIAMGTADAIIDTVLFFFCALTFYIQGPRILMSLQRLSPMDDAYDQRLFDVFWQLAQNVVLASFATAAIQGVVAAIGYSIVGVDRVVFLGIATGIFSYVPLVGTALIWVPVVIGVGVTGSWGWALFLAIYSLGLTTSIDNVVKPFFIRGQSEIHPLLVFLSVFGGLYWMGIPGILIGPVAVAAFLALYTIHVQHFLGVEPLPERLPGLDGSVDDESQDDVESPST